MQKRSKVLLAIVILLFASLVFPYAHVQAKTGAHLIVINKKTNQMAYYTNGKLTKVFLVGTGRKTSYTPEGTFKIVNKIKNRPYYKENIPGGSPKNPLGVRWLGLEARGTYGTTYAIHGNNNTASIGGYVSGGCIRMYNEQVLWLFERVPIGTPVIITSSNLDFNKIAANKGYKVSGVMEVSLPPVSKTLKQGAKGAEVKRLQIRLQNRGFNPNGIDGVYGKGTMNAVKQFQRSKSMKADGIASAQTLRALGL